MGKRAFAASVQLKVCMQCGCLLPGDAFRSDRRVADGLAKICKTCYYVSPPPETPEAKAGCLRMQQQFEDASKRSARRQVEEMWKSCTSRRAIDIRRELGIPEPSQD